MSQKTKQMLFALVIIAISFVGFKMFFSNTDSVDLALVAENSQSGTFVNGQDVLIMLNKLNAVTLDDAVFSNKVFVNLQSFERTLESQTLRRPNPFLPIGVNSSLIVSTSTR